jgi:hypothetical protein
MARNDVVLVDSIVQERLKEGFPSKQQDEVFEYFAFEQVLKDFDLSRDEIELGWVDGRDDGGIDGFFVFVNGHMLQDTTTFTWPKRNAEIEVHILTCKHHDTFQQAPLNSLLASLPELLDLSSDNDRLKTRYSADVLSAREILLDSYKALSVARPSLSFRLSYVSRGESTQVATNIRARADQVIRLTEGLFSQCSASFDFVGATELITLYRRTKTFSLDLRVIEYLTTGPGSYVGIARLDDFHKFVTDDSGNLRRYLFDSNVRDFLGKKGVNEDISASLADPEAPEFWWLNNGITMLATGVTAGGKVLHIQDIQIVNGLQTTESIFRYFHSGDSVPSDRGVLIKVVVSTNAEVRDRIIRATNNQSPVEGASLHATDKVQRDIEEVLERNEWYYERRRNYYRNIGRPPARFVTPLYLASGFVALVMKNPALAARLKNKFMRTQQGYSSVFSDDIPLSAWVKITEILKKIESVLSEVRPTQVTESERFLAKWRSLVALLTVARLSGTFSFKTGDLVSFNAEMLTREIIIETWELIESGRHSRAKEREFRSAGFVLEACRQAAEKYGITDQEVVGKRRPGPGTDATRRWPAPSEEFIRQIDALLPPQPWQPSLHIAIAKKLGCHKRTVSAAIKLLIASGKRLQQVDGVVYDQAGQVATDAQKVDTGSLP